MERIETVLRSGETLEEADLASLVADLARLPEQESRSVVERAAKDLGPRSVPLLQAVATAAGGVLALAATQSMGRIRHQVAATALQRVAAAGLGNDIRKAARRGLHSLASLGIRPAPRAVEAPEKKKAKEEIIRALSSPIDGLGDRALWLTFGSGSEIEFLGLVLNEEKGIVDAFSSEMARSRFDREAARVLRDERFPWAEIPVDYCRHLVEEALSKNAATGTALPREYLAWRDRIGRPQRSYEKPLAYEVINAAEVRWNPRYLDSSDELLNLEVFQAWLMGQDDLAEFLRERETARESGLVLAGMNAEVRERMILDRAIQVLFDARRRALYKRRLEEMAYLLWKQERLELARMALAAAMALEPPDRPLLNHPFLRSLVEWNLDVVGAMVRGERTRDIKPGVRLYLPY